MILGWCNQGRVGRVLDLFRWEFPTVSTENFLQFPHSNYQIKPTPKCCWWRTNNGKLLWDVSSIVIVEKIFNFRSLKVARAHINCRKFQGSTHISHFCFLLFCELLRKTRRSLTCEKLTILLLSSSSNLHAWDCESSRDDATTSDSVDIVIRVIEKRFSHSLELLVEQISENCVCSFLVRVWQWSCPEEKVEEMSETRLLKVSRSVLFVHLSFIESTFKVSRLSFKFSTHLVLHSKCPQTRSLKCDTRWWRLKSSSKEKNTKLMLRVPTKCRQESEFRKKKERRVV